MSHARLLRLTATNIPTDREREESERESRRTEPGSGSSSTQKRWKTGSSWSGKKGLRPAAGGKRRLEPNVKIAPISPKSGPLAWIEVGKL